MGNFGRSTGEIAIGAENPTGARDDRIMIRRHANVLKRTLKIDKTDGVGKAVSIP